jgi:protein arginine kinase
MRETALPPSPLWLRTLGPHSDVIISSRCRIARNLTEYPFPHKATSAHREAIWLSAQHALTSCSTHLLHGSLPPSALRQLLTARYISPDHRATGVLISQDGTASCLVNEEDHLRFQAMLPGLQVEYAHAAASGLLELCQAESRFAVHPEFGVLTADPRHSGYGIRYSVMLHLIGLKHSGRMWEILKSIQDTGCSVRGVWGENTGELGGVVQISLIPKRSTNPRDAETRISSAAQRICSFEREARAIKVPAYACRLQPSAADNVESVSAQRAEAAVKGDENALLRTTQRMAELLAEFRNTPVSTISVSASSSAVEPGREILEQPDSENRTNR